MSSNEIIADISIPLRFGGPQPNAYGVEPASARPLGDTRSGSSVNFEEYTFTPHCNGTHTECVGHITDQRISVRDSLKDVIVSAVLVSVEPENRDGELLITADLLRNIFMPEESALADRSVRSPALIVRTLPNDDRKLTAVYGEGNIPPYFSSDAMRYIVEQGLTHLLCDLPSIDRIFDDGKLINHRIFWNLQEGKNEIDSASRVNSTITEMIYVPDNVPDGRYFLNLQIAPFESDCAPSRPLLLSTRYAISELT